MPRFRALALVMLFTAVAAVSFAPAAHAGGFCDKPVSDGRTVSVVTEKDCFAPTVVRVDVGQRLTFTNRDDVPHTVTGVGHQWGEDLPVGQTVTVRFAEPGTYPYFCHIHMGMIGTVVVGNGIPTANSASESAVITSTVPIALTTTSTTTRLSGSPAGLTRVAGSDGPRPSGVMGLALAAIVAGLLALGIVVRRRQRPRSGSHG